MNEPVPILILLAVGISVLLAFYLRKVAQLQKEARENPIPDHVEAVSKDITVHTYQVQYQLKRLKTAYPDPLSALVDAIHNVRHRGSRT